jgi:hypothetical protein
MRTFILGYLPDTDFTKQNLVEFENKNDAAFESEEWVVVTAETLEIAKDKYDATFLKWKESCKITPISDLPNIQMLVDLGEVTYRGTADMAPEPSDCVLITVGGQQEYLISMVEFTKLGGIRKIRFSAKYRQHN